MHSGQHLADPSEQGLEATRLQRNAFREHYRRSTPKDWAFHRTSDEFTRYLRDRRLRLGIRTFLDLVGRSPAEMDALVVCGAPGGEGIALADLGFRSVTVSDFAAEGLQFCQLLDGRLKTKVLDAENLDVPPEAFDLVLVQDGLHHLPRPALGLTEMLRVASKGVVVIEPHSGIVARLLGTRWENTEGEINFVFRWNEWLIREICLSYLLKRVARIEVKRLWDHHVILGTIGRRVGRGWWALWVVKSIYAVLNALVPWMGNMMIAVITKQPGPDVSPRS
jgi:SAM-dependent methyltransferase